MTGDIPENPLEGIHNYSEGLTVSQVVKYFERQGMTFTKTMIQNYVRIGLLPAPEGKRLYGHKHIMMLAMIHDLKAVLPLEDLKALFAMYPDGFEYMEEMYGLFMGAKEEARIILKKMEAIYVSSGENQIGSPDKNEFSAVLALAALASLAGNKVTGLIR